MRFSGMSLVLTLASVGLTYAQAQPAPPTGAADLFVPLIPGLAATDICIDQADTLCAPAGVQNGRVGLLPQSGIPTDALGSIYLQEPYRTVWGECNVAHGIELLTQMALQRLVSGSLETIGAFRDKCNPTNLTAVVGVKGMDMDVVNGTLYVRLDVNTNDGADNSGTQAAIIRITGFPSLLDIIPTFDPNNASAVSWVTPLRPEAMAGSDKFSVYAGPLVGPSSLSQVVPLDCSVPDIGSPSPGDYFSVPDTLGPLQAGAGRFFLIANHFHGQVRVGRETTGQVIKGRNVNALTGCQ